MIPSTQRRRPRRVLTAALAAIVLAGCGGGTPGPSGVAPTGAVPTAAAPTSAGPNPTPPPATTSRACDLLSDADLEELTGSTVVSKDDNVADTVYANHCRWTLQRADGGMGELDLGVLSPGGRDRYDHTGGPSGLEPIDGLPADAAGMDDLTNSVFAVRGDTMVDLFALGLGLDADAKVAIVRRVLEHLGG